MPVTLRASQANSEQPSQKHSRHNSLSGLSVLSTHFGFEILSSRRFLQYLKSSKILGQITSLTDRNNEFIVNSMD